MDERLTFNSHTATEYDKGIRRTLPTYDGLVRLAGTALRMHTGDMADVLLVGAGGGNELMEYASHYPGWTFTAADPSEAMLLEAERKAADLADGRVAFVRGSAADVPDDAVFDSAACLLVLHFIASESGKRDLLAEIRSRLKPGAPLVIAAMAGDRSSAAFEFQFSLWRQYWLDRTSLDAGQIEDMETGIRALSFLPEAEIEQLLTDAGFGSITRFFQTTFFTGWVCRAV